jgi:acetyl-CoA synthetase
MGRPLPGWDVQILDEDERPVRPGVTGEICLRARSNPRYPLGYWNRPRDTEDVFGGEWCHTKNAARMDEDGYIWYEGRADDVIISAGYRIGPFEVESACLEHPAVAEVAAAAAPDERRGFVVRAFIVLGTASSRATSWPRRSRRSSAITTPPTPIRGRSSSSANCPRR